MADPRQKSLEYPPSLSRMLPRWIAPQWTEAERWRAVVRNQPIAIIARDKLIAYIQSLPWDIRPKEIKNAKKLQPDIDYYKDFVLKSFDVIIDKLWQDVLDIPVGGNVETVRWAPGTLPTVEVNGEQYKVTQPWARGHVFKLVNIDGATLVPTHDPQFPMMQRVQGNISNVIFFNPNEISRILMTPRTEWSMAGFGMPPPQRIFLALTLLFRGDQYYANLLLDTPEAGILDMADMEQEAAFEWVEGYKNLMEGIDGFKIGVAYNHDKPWTWIPFGRPPTDMMFNEITEKYARVTAAGYFLSLSDLGLEKGAGTLAGTIRQQRDARLSGFGIVREKTENWVNDNVVPPYLDFAWIEQDDEALLNTGRARLTNAQAMKAMAEAGFITAVEGQEQLVKDGLLTIEVKPPKEEEAAPPPQAPGGQQALPPGQEGSKDEDKEAGDGKELDDTMKKIPASQGGRKAFVEMAPVSVGDESISAVPPGSTKFDQLLIIFQTAFDDVLTRGGDIQMRRLIKAAARLQFPVTSKAVFVLTDPADLAQFSDERVAAWFGEPSMLDDFPDVQKIDAETLSALDRLMESDDWWKIPGDLQEQIAYILELAFGEGATIAAEEIQQFLYEEGLVTSPDLIGFNFDLKNPATIGLIQDSAAVLVTQVNDGTKHFMRRIITSGVDEGFSSQKIAQQIRDGAGLNEILRDSNFNETVVKEARNEIGAVNRKRAMSIVNTEIAKAEVNGRVKQWSEIGLSRKAWQHVASDVPCKVCQANIDLGFVDINFLYTTVFGENQQLGPPGHPSVCHCFESFDVQEVIDKAGELDVWTGA